MTTTAPTAASIKDATSATTVNTIDTSRATPWTDERLHGLEQMWLWGLPSSVIARTLGGITRNAVMGKVNRLGLMKQGGVCIGASREGAVNVDEMTTTIGSICSEPFDKDNDVHAAMFVAFAALLSGRSPAVIERATGWDQARVGKILTQISATGAWRDGASPPAQWWNPEHSTMGFMLDMMAATGMFVVTDADKYGEERCYEALENAEKRKAKDGRK